MNAICVTDDATRVCRRDELTAADREDMVGLLDRHFEGVSREQFEEDLRQKDWVIRLIRDGRLVGFSTLMVREMVFEGRNLLAIFSGDTIVAPEAWGSSLLARAWISTVNRIRSENPGLLCYWLLLVSGFRTYRFLPVFWKDFFPRVDCATPAYSHRLLNHLAMEGYGASFDSRAGLVRFPRPQRLRGSLASVPAGREMNPDVAFFLSKNPGHLAGDELVCITEITEANLTAAGRRMVRDVR